MNWSSFANIQSVHTGNPFKKVIWVSLKCYAYHFQWKFWLTTELYNFLSYNGVVLTISLVSLSVAKRRWQQSYAPWSQKKIKQFAKRQMIRSVNFVTHCECMVFIRMLLGTYLFFKDSQEKQIDDHLVWFAAAVVESKLSVGSVAVSLYVFPRLDLY